ncbi:MAG TPA: exopolysaccharide biosynthesis protein [Opitutaceae bacterium]|nr:exopolysaccharide biosynthesis protein [Opitutaceae bacterium]
MAPEPDPRPEKQPRLSEELAGLQARFAEQSVTLGEVVQVLHGRAYLLLVLLLALPFCAPISVPGLSTPLGFVIALIALRQALGQKPWLPERMLRMRLPPGFFRRVLVVAERVIRFLETFLRPRATGFVDAPVLRNLHAVMMLMAAGFLLLPLPIPLTNTVPAWVILLIAAGLLERDGVFIALGYAVAVASVVGLALLGGAAHQLLDMVRRWLTG